MSKISIKDLINKKYGRLTIVGKAKLCKKRQNILCLCDCGNFMEVRFDDLKRGFTKSCGCLRREKVTTHGLGKYSLYQIWNQMKQRCYNFKNTAYKDWGGRGIKVCDEWINNPEKFIKWALINGWKKGLYIDRINNNGNYEPNNVRFVDAGLNSRNTRLLNSTNKSGYRGVSWSKNAKKWVTQITINKKTKNLGFFNSLKLAALRYDAAAFLLNDGRPFNFN